MSQVAQRSATCYVRLVVARERARQPIQETARTLQESILPGGVPPIAGCELAVRFIPGRGPVSGDFYDVLEIAPDTWGVLIGDVCGKGVPAAAATAMARWTLPSALSRPAAPSEALRLLNDVMPGNQPDDRFITAACLKLTVEPGIVTVDIVCAGHPAPVLVPAEGSPAGADAEELAGILEDLSRQPVGRHPDDIASSPSGTSVRRPRWGAGAGLQRRGRGRGHVS
jgi:serine phosphatase RsbU (regulator of sigma subunit)